MKSQNSANKPKLGQGREGLRREMEAPPQVQSQVQIKDENKTIYKHINKPRVTEIKIPIYPDPLMKPPPRLPDVKI